MSPFFHIEQQHTISVQTIRELLQSYMKGCNLVYDPQTASHNQFLECCIAEAKRRGYITKENDALEYCMPAGVSMACNAYHYQSYEVRIFISFFTAFIVYADDKFEHNIDDVQTFNYRFITQAPQEDPILDHFARLLLEMPALFGLVEANIMITATLNVITGLSIENAFRNVTLEPSANRFPEFSRDMTGGSDVYTLFSFPPEVPLAVKLQVIPDCRTFVNDTNDILSFYKEQRAGDTVNRVSLVSQCRGISSDAVMRELIRDTTAAHSRVLATLSKHGSAAEAYRLFAQGYVTFHTNLPQRYRLHEVGLTSAQPDKIQNSPACGCM
ncbi:isoprenoid synthase domain-containing protein [Xylariales sp. PMI_506]|nr:isoprenoid synthase domain-containing protein [Xylariales sp. PMI_506]